MSACTRVCCMVVTAPVTRRMLLLDDARYRDSSPTVVSAIAPAEQLTDMTLPEVGLYLAALMTC